MEKVVGSCDSEIATLRKLARNDKKAALLCRLWQQTPPFLPLLPA